jgi:hypothetical protein
MLFFVFWKKLSGLYEIERASKAQKRQQKSTRQPTWIATRLAVEQDCTLLAD